jgi:hypothetical protein
VNRFCRVATCRLSDALTNSYTTHRAGASAALPKT